MTSSHTTLHQTMHARSPEDLLAIVPVVLGFHPQESLVMLTSGLVGRAFHGRVDLPTPDRPDLVGGSVLPLRIAAQRNGVTRVAFVIYTEHRDLALATAAEVERSFADVGIMTMMRAHADGWSFVEGGELSPVQARGESTHRFSAQAVFEGTVTHASRADLAASLRPDPPGVAEVKAKVGRHLLLARHGSTEEGWIAERVSRRPTLKANEVARLVVGLQSIPLRDAAWSRITRSSAADLLPWWTEVLRRTPQELVAPPASLLAFTAWLAGNGALAWCALDRCLVVDPDYSAATLVASVLDGAIPPSAWEDSTGDGRR